MNLLPRILLVEDEAELAAIVELHLSTAGFRVEAVDDGLAALHSFDADPPDLVLLDLLLPTISGFRLLNLFKRRSPDVPVIVVTAHHYEEVEEVAQAGADDLVTKPFDPAVLVEKAQHLACRRARPDVSEARPPPRILVGVVARERAEAAF